MAGNQDSMTGASKAKGSTKQSTNKSRIRKRKCENRKTRNTESGSNADVSTKSSQKSKNISNNEMGVPASGCMRRTGCCDAYFCKIAFYDGSLIPWRNGSFYLAPDAPILPTLLLTHSVSSQTFSTHIHLAMSI